ncbi:hypothetical protein LMG10733_1319 [Bifidobacterium adolescentis]|uniref:DUF4913 domain-containing protein n=2 Tax=Bifidobacterium adolescentis TaxID=1680 RepID=A1A2U1_BIFAA|nr:DUF4913 domain-containing protein [Bifidobacterium adolescentis]NRD15875.1 DUF4913 domain-containing protein [Bifidobacterium adolescentis]OSG97431.1 hypothetical protein LMG10733_1319 [Bifidobacterium adolescentis]BAF40024.1 hypothetical protein BAD_1243 [Bifidobacterium adolescentis ATCC 15703]SPU23439.1 Uncharacterised protein [Bifidobacterium adolescentis]
MGFGSFIERLSMAFHRNPSKDKEFQTIRKAMVFPPNLSADAPAAPVPLPWSDALPPEPPAPPQTASGNVRVEELTIEDGPELERAVAATFAVDGVKDATRYGLTIPFLRWLIAYKAELTAEDFAVVSREDLIQVERKRTDARRHSSNSAYRPRPSQIGIEREPNSNPKIFDATTVDSEGRTSIATIQNGGEPADGNGIDDVLSTPESREIGDDQAEREALVGQFGARTQMRDTYYPNLACFVELHVANMWPYQQGVMTKFLWVPDWWRYPPLIYQLDALWRAYENARRQPGQMMIFSIQAFGLLDRVFNKDTGLVASLGIDETEHTTGPNEPLPCIRPPRGWRRKAMEPLRPIRPKDMDEPIPTVEMEKQSHRMIPKMRSSSRNQRKQQEGNR